MYHCSDLERPVGLPQLQKTGPKMTQNLVFPVFGPGETGKGTQLGPNFCNHQRDVGPRYPVPIQGYPMMCRAVKGSQIVAKVGKNCHF